MMGYYGYGNAGGGGAWFGMLMMLFFGLLVLIGIVLLVVWAVRSSSGHGHVGGMGHMGPPAAPGHDEAVAIARRRLASGEITKEQFDEIMGALGGQASL